MNDKTEFSRVVELSAIGQNGKRCKIFANSKELVALAKRFDLLCIEYLSADLDLRRSKGGDEVVVNGRVFARVTQQCAITLAPIVNQIEEEIYEIFRSMMKISPDAGMIDDEENYDEVFDGSLIDIGEMLAQCFALRLDPYPRKLGAKFEELEENKEKVETSSPFAQLAALKLRKF